MCGIGGFYTNSNILKNLEEKLERVAISLRHRGPDAKATWVSQEKNIGLCHTRLSIIDLNNRANQPMYSNDKRYILVFNGEIYNFKELKIKLLEKGCKFLTESDSEILIEGYRVWNKEILNKIEGMFAFAIYDTVNKTLFLARDHIGKKPLYYAVINNSFIFSSEIPSIKIFFEKILNYNYAAISSIFLRNIRNIAPPYTAFKEILKLRPGSYLKVYNGEIIESNIYYRLNKNTNFSFSDLIKKQVSKRLVSHVPIGIMLSGGLDSSVIAYLASQKTEYQIKSYSIGSNEKDPDIINSKKLAKILNFDHKEIFYNHEEDFEIYKDLIIKNGEPICLLPLIHTKKISNEANKDKIKVLLSGNGADELFYGYDNYIKSYIFSILLNKVKKVSKFINFITNNNFDYFFDEDGKRKAQLYNKEKNEYWLNFIDKNRIKNIDNFISKEIESLASIGKFEDYIDESNFAGLMIENSHSLTLAADLAGMSSSVEIRSPFLDKDMIDYAFTIKPSDKIKFQNGAFVSKYPLRNFAKSILPETIINRSKRGLGYEFSEKNLLSKKWRKIAENYFLNPNDLNGFFSKKKLITSWDLFNKGKINANIIFKQFVVQLWLNTIND